MPQTDVQFLLSTLPPLEQRILLASAAPPWFDEVTLNAMFEDRESGSNALAVVLAHLSLSLAEDLPGYHVLDTAQRDELLELLWNRERDFYRVCCRRTVAHFANLVECTATSGRALHETGLMSLLDMLFGRYMSTHEVIELAAVLDLADAALLSRPEYRHRFEYYRGCTANERQEYATAESIFTRLLDESDLHDRLRARVLTALGINYNYRDRYDEAIDAYAESRLAYVRLADLLGQAKALSNIGILYSQLGRYEEAIAVLEESYGLTVEVDDLVQQGRVANELGLAAKELGRWDAALDSYKKALGIWLVLGNRVSQGRVYNNLGEVYYLTGRWDEARQNFKAALAIALHPEVQDKRQAADMLHNLGLLCFSQGQFDEARTHYEQSLDLGREIDSAAAISQIHHRLGQLWESLGQPRQAYREYQQAIEVIETMRGWVARQETKISLLGTRQQPYEVMVLLCWRLGWHAEAFHYAERARARAFLDLLTAKPSDGAAPLNAENQTEEPLMLGEICSRLPHDAALVAFFTTGVLEWGEGAIQRLPAETRHLREHLMPPARTLAFLLTQSGLVEHQELAIDPNVLRPGPTDDSARDPRALDERKTIRLYDRLLAPIWCHVKDKRVLYVVPHGPLHYLPFGALRGPDGHWVVHPDHPCLAYGPSATVLLSHCCASSSAAPKSCLALGHNGTGPSALRYAEEEAGAIAQLWKGEAWTGGGSKKAQLQRMGGKFRVLHFACHGHFSPSKPLDSSLRLADGELITAGEILEHLSLNADLVSLSACQSGISHVARGDEMVGLIRAFLSAGASSLVVTQWQVGDAAARILMEQFHRNLIRGMSCAEALQAAQVYLQKLTVREVKTILKAFGEEEEEIASQIEGLCEGGPAKCAAPAEDALVFAHPRHWAPFILIGRA